MWLLSLQSGDDGKAEEEEGGGKVIPKWKAYNITEIIIEPEPEEPEVEAEEQKTTTPAAEEGGEQTEQAAEEQGENSALKTSFVQLFFYKHDFCTFRFRE